MSQENSAVPSTPKPGFRARFATLLNVYLAVMVAVYSVATAYAAYQASISDSNEADQYFEGLARLNDANFFYSEGHQRILYDYHIFDQLQVAALTNEDPAVIEYLSAQFTQAGQESLRDGVLDDDAYRAQIFSVADDQQAQADTAFAAARLAGNRADSFQLVVLALAIGLSFTGWASLADDRSALRWVFAVFAMIVLMCSGAYAVLWLLS